MRSVLLLCVVSTFTACGGGESGAGSGGVRGPESSPSTGTLVVIGGALSPDNEAIYRAVLVRRLGAGPVCVVPTASAEPAESGASAVERFDRYGGAGSAVALELVVDRPDAAADPLMVKRMAECAGFYFVGGQQSRITRLLGTKDAPTPVLRALLQRFEDGVVVSGSSAGAAIMSHPMIGGGASAEAVLEGVGWRVGLREAGDGGGGEDGAASGEEPGGVLLDGGLGLLEGVLVDQHFLARGRIGRLIAAVLDPRTSDLGMGVDENTALVVEDGVAGVVGASGVVVVDGSSATGGSRGTPGSPLRMGGVQGVTVHLLGRGDAYDLTRREVLPAAGGTPPGDRPRAGEGGGDLFARWELLHALRNLAGSSRDSVVSTGEGFRVVIRKGPGFQARVRAEEGVQGVEEGFGAGPFLVDLLPEGP